MGVERDVDPRAREMYARALEVSSSLLSSLLGTAEKERQETEQQRYNKCLKALNQVRSFVEDERQLRELEQIKHSLPLTVASLEDVDRTVKGLTALKQKCPYCRELYLRLANSYLLQGDEKNASDVLSCVMPNLKSSLSTVSTPKSYPFWIAAWDAERLDLFNNDVSEVDVEFVAAWMRLFVMERNPSMVVALWSQCLKEPRFRDWKASDRLLQPFSFLSTWVVGFPPRWDVDRFHLLEDPLRVPRIHELLERHSAMHRRDHSFPLSLRRLELARVAQPESALFLLSEQRLV